MAFGVNRGKRDLSVRTPMPAPVFIRIRLTMSELLLLSPLKLIVSHKTEKKT